jgi:hypothetical protein
MEPTPTSIAQRFLGGVDLLLDLATLGEYGLEPLPADAPCERSELRCSDWEALAGPSAGRAHHRRREPACAPSFHSDWLHDRPLSA